MTNPATETKQSSTFSIIKDWAADLVVRWRREPVVTATHEPATTNQNQDWKELSGPRLSAFGASGREHFAHKIIDKAQLEISNGNGPVTFKTNDPRVKQIIRDIDPQNSDAALNKGDYRPELTVRRRLTLDAKESTASGEVKMTRAALKKQLEDIEAALQMGEKIVVRLEIPALARDKALQQTLRRFLKTEEYTAGNKLLLKVDGAQQDAVWKALGKGFLSAKEKKARATATPDTKAPAPEVTPGRAEPAKAPAIARDIREADSILQKKLREFTTEKPPTPVVIRIDSVDSFTYAEKHLRRLQKLYGAELVQVKVTSPELRDEIQALREARKSMPGQRSDAVKRNADEPVQTSTEDRRNPRKRSAPEGHRSKPAPLHTEDDIAAFLRNLTSEQPDKVQSGFSSPEKKTAPTTPPVKDEDPEFEKVSLDKIFYSDTDSEDPTRALQNS